MSVATFVGAPSAGRDSAAQGSGAPRAPRCAPAAPLVFHCVLRHLMLRLEASGGLLSGSSVEGRSIR